MKDKKCKCGTILTTDTAYKKGNRLQSKCKKCFNSYCIQRWIDRKIWAIKYKGDKCFDCNNQFHYCVYDFHHLDPKEKDLDWNKMRLVSKKILLKELDKCVLLCSNCHRIRHYGMAGSMGFEPIIKA